MRATRGHVDSAAGCDQCGTYNLGLCADWATYLLSLQVDVRFGSSVVLNGAPADVVQ